MDNDNRAPDIAAKPDTKAQEAARRTAAQVSGAPTKWHRGQVYEDASASATWPEVQMQEVHDLARLVADLEQDALPITGGGGGLRQGERLAYFKAAIRRIMTVPIDKGGDLFVTNDADESDKCRDCRAKKKSA